MEWVSSKGLFPSFILLSRVNFPNSEIRREKKKSQCCIISLVFQLTKLYSIKTKVCYIQELTGMWIWQWSYWCTRKLSGTFYRVWTLLKSRGWLIQMPLFFFQIELHVICLFLLHLGYPWTRLEGEIYTSLNGKRALRKFYPSLYFYKIYCYYL